MYGVDNCLKYLIRFSKGKIALHIVKNSKRKAITSFIIIAVNLLAYSE